MKTTFLLVLALTATSHAADPDPLFNGKDLTGWSTSQDRYWSVEDGAIVGRATEQVPLNEFLWSEKSYSDFRLVVDVKLTPDQRNAGIQFRSKPVNDHGQANGYQADVGAGVWGKLYHEHGRGKLDWNNHAAKAMKRGDWNRYEILAVGHRIWTAINGTLCVAIDDPEGEIQGKIAFQIHSGPAQEVRYRVVEFEENPKLQLKNQTRQQLLDALPERKSPSTFAPLLAPLKQPTTPAPGFRNGFNFQAGQNLVILGGANAAQCRRHGQLEAALRMSRPEIPLRIRNMAQPTDTLFEQRRPRNFFSPTTPDYGERDGRPTLSADIVLLWFGQMESLNHEADAIIKRYETLIDDLGRYTEAIVLITPVPFGDPLTIGLNPDRRNASLDTLTQSIIELGKRRGLPVVDLSALGDVTVDGALLSPDGHHHAARAIVRQLGDPADSPSAPAALLERIREKNRLWGQYWQPTNWAFLYGNRQTQPSSRDHQDRSKRWFPDEVREALEQLEEIDNQIDRALTHP